jgi:predicted O-linked N-acetylglucosamine transferase (SPINDLY family)
VRINERVIAAWSQILHKVPGSRLVLNHTPFLEPATQELYAARFAAHGITPDRIDLVYTSPQPRTWDAYAGIDIALDPFPHNAGTTTIEALWLGVPVLSLAERASVGRFGASILGAVGLSDWVADDVDGYVAKAVAAASDLDALATLRNELRDRFKASPLYDAPGLAQAMEETYRDLWNAWCDADTPSYEDAVAAFQKNDLTRAETFCNQLIAAKTHEADALHLRGLVHYRRNANEEANADIASAIALNPNVAEWHANHAAVLRRLGRLADSAAASKAAIALNPNVAEAHNNLANALKELGQYSEAEAHLRKAAELKPGYADAWSNLSSILSIAGQALEAETTARRALALDPNNANAHNHLGTALLLLERLPEAGAAFAEALRLKPDFALAHSNLLFCHNYRTDLSPEEIFAEYRRWDALHAKPLAPQNSQWPNARDPKRRLKVGYMSPDFRYHAVSFFIEPLLAAHDRGEIELHLYGEVAAPDAITDRFRGLADHWRSTVGLSDAAVVEMIRADGIDVLVDLGGHTAASRLTVFARRPAPVQITHTVGHGYTTGLSAINAVLGDAAMMPGGSDHLFSERVLRLDRIPLVYAPPPGLPAVTPLPALTNKHITFGCFSRIARINDGVIAAWAQILARAPNARLVLNSKPFREEGTRASFAARFAAHGISADRLDLIYTSPQPKTWDAYGAIDIALDPFPHNAGTTTIEALWLGVPVVSLADRPSVGRFGASILGSVGLSDWVAGDVEAYVAKAVAAASDIPALADLRSTLRDRFEASPLRDAPGLARAVERAYRQLWTEYCQS